MKHVERLEQVFSTLGERARERECEGIAGILDEGEEIMAEDFDEATMDAALIAAAQRAEHYEIAAYGTVVAWALAMGHDEVVGLLEETLAKEKAADEKLTSLPGGLISKPRRSLIRNHNLSQQRRKDRHGKKSSRTPKSRIASKPPITDAAYLPGRLCDRCSGVTPQERQRLLIEFSHVLVDRRVRAPFEDEKLGTADAARQSIREPRRRQLIAAPECDLGWRRNSPELCFDVVGKNGIRLLDEVRH